MRRLVVILTLALALVFGLASTAQAGRGFFTGHDADDHCNFKEPQCQLLKVAVDYAISGAPDRSKPLLLIACSGTLLGGVTNAYAPAAPPATSVVCPSKDPAAFNALRITTGTYSAIVVGSSVDSINMGGAGPVDSDLLAGRKNDIAAFFNAGGGIVALAGDQFGDGDPATGKDSYYDFVPLPAVGKKVSGPFRLTPEGQSLGLQDSRNGVGTIDAINCCPTHNSFNEPPSGSALKVAERDSSVPPAPESLFADGSIGAGGFTPGSSSASPPPAFGPNGVASLPSNKKCFSRRVFPIRIKQRKGRVYETVLIFVNNKRVAVRRGRRTSAQIDLRGLPKGRFVVRISVVTTRGEIITGTRAYRTCTPKRKGQNKGPL